MRNLTLSAVCVDDDLPFWLPLSAHKRPIPDDESPPGKRPRMSDDLLMRTVPRLDPLAWIRRARAPPSSPPPLFGLSLTECRVVGEPPSPFIPQPVDDSALIAAVDGKSFDDDLGVWNPDHPDEGDLPFLGDMLRPGPPSDDRYEDCASPEKKEPRKTETTYSPEKKKRAVAKYKPKKSPTDKTNKRKKGDAGEGKSRTPRVPKWTVKLPVSPLDRDAMGRPFFSRLASCADHRDAEGALYPLLQHPLPHQPASFVFVRVSLTCALGVWGGRDGWSVRECRCGHHSFACRPQEVCRCDKRGDGPSLPGGLGKPCESQSGCVACGFPGTRCHSQSGAWGPQPPHQCLLGTQSYTLSGTWRICPTHDTSVRRVA